MTDYERNSFSPITERETIVRAHSPYSEATGPILREGSVAARVRAFHNSQEPNSYTPSEKGISTRVQLRSYKVTSPTTGDSTKGDDSRSGYGRRKSLSFAPPASRNASIGGQHRVPLTRYTPQSSVLPGSGAGTRIEKVGNRFVVVGPDTLSQHVVFSSLAVFPPKHAGPDEGVGFSPGSKLVGEHGLAVLDSVNNEEASTEQKKVLKKKNIAEELGVKTDKAVDDNNSSQTEWSNDSPNPDTLDHHGRALGELNSSPPASAPLVPIGRRRSSSDYQSIAATRHSSTSSGSDHSKGHRHHRRIKCHRKCSTAEETILPRSDSDTEEYASCLDNTAESDTTVQRQFPHNKAAPASPPATISPCSPRTHVNYYGCQHQHRIQRWGTTPPRTVIGHKDNQLEEISRPRLIRKYEISSLLQNHKHHHDHSHQAIPRPHHTPPHNQHHTPSPHHHLRHHSHTRVPRPIRHPDREPPSKLPPRQTSPSPPPTIPPSSLPLPNVPPPSRTPPFPLLTRLRPPLRHHSLPTLAPPLLSPPLATASLLQSRHLSASSAPPTKPTPKRSGWWQFMHADKPDEVYEMAEAQLAPHEQPDRELRSSDGGHTLRECGHEHDAAEQAAGATQQRAASAGADAAGEPLALTRPLPATHPQHARADEGKRNPVACSDVDITTGCTGESDAGGKNERHDMRGGGAKGGGVGIRGVKVVVSLDAGGGVVVEARVKGRGRGRD